jgi:putative ABC transport system permease protein
MTPPALARRLLLRLLPPADRSAILGDLDEEFAHVCGEAGPRAARRWYWRQALTSVPSIIRLRHRARRRSPWSQSGGERLLPQVMQDARYAVRSWRREPLFAATAMTTQALGVAVAGAVLSVAYGVLIAPPPYASPEALLRIHEAGRSGQFSYADYMELRRSTRSLSHVVGFSGGSRTFTGHGSDADQVPSAEVTAGFFEALGVPPAYGRTFAAAESRRDAAPVVIVTHGAWQRRFGSDPALVGRAITLGGRPTTVVGILPADFEFPLRGLAELWLPLRTSQAQEERGYWHWLDVIARRAPGVTDAQVAADLELVSGLRAREDPKWHGSARMRAIPIRDEIVAPMRPALLILLGGVALLFATATANVAGLVLARSGARARELSVRAAIGAGPGRLARQLVTESVLLTVAGSAAGLLAGHWLVRAAIQSLPRQQRATVLHADRLGVTPEIAAAVLLVSIGFGLVFGVLPRLRRAEGSLTRALTSRTATGANARARAALVAAEIALALMLITGTGLLARSVYRLSQVSPGFDPGGLLTLRMAMPAARYGGAPGLLATRERLLEAFGAVPGVTGVATIDQLPLTGGGNNGTLQIAGRPAAGDDGPTVIIRTVSPDYFDVMGIPLRSGRGFTDRDREGAPLVVLVNERLAAQVFGDAPIGERVTFEFIPGRPLLEIVGVVGDEQFEALDRGRSPVLYFPSAQDADGNFSVVIRTTRPDSVVPALRRAAGAIDPLLPLYSVRTMEEIAGQSSAMFFRRAVLSMLGVFALAALLLAAIGVYGTLAYVVSQRTREIGIRVALGARRNDVVRLMLRHGMTPAFAGAGLGLLGSLGLAGFLRSFLFGVEPNDTATLVASVVFLSSVALAACLVPVLRAARVDPAITLRQD